MFTLHEIPIVVDPSRRSTGLQSSREDSGLSVRPTSKAKISTLRLLKMVKVKLHRNGGWFRQSNGRSGVLNEIPLGIKHISG